ncbi:MAG: hypothetical protein QOF30_1454 [Acidimicrobiaceae bacterium]|jgi:hypothetical protein|nr:hypothetical protein [Acidimicrobiaceae bacterium]
MKRRERREDPGDAVVELTRVAFIGEAIAIKQDLERVGIRASVFESDAGGWAPHYGIWQGNRVMVLASDLAQAQQLLSDDGGQLAAEAPEPRPPSSAVRKHRRPHIDIEPPSLS